MKEEEQRRAESDGKSLQWRRREGVQELDEEDQWVIREEVREFDSGRRKDRDRRKQLERACDAVVIDSYRPWGDRCNPCGPDPDERQKRRSFQTTTRCYRCFRFGHIKRGVRDEIFCLWSAASSESENEQHRSGRGSGAN